MRPFIVLLCAIALTACSDSNPSKSEIEAAIAFTLPHFIEVSEVEIGSNILKERSGSPVTLTSAKVEMRYKEDTFVATDLFDGKVIRSLRKKGDVFNGRLVAASTKIESGGWDIEIEELNVAPKDDDLGKPASEFPAGSVIEGSDEFLAYKAEYLANQEAMRIKKEEAILAAKAQAKQKIIDDGIALKKLVNSNQKYRGSHRNTFGGVYNMTIKFTPANDNNSKFTGEMHIDNDDQCLFTFKGYIEENVMIFSDNKNPNQWCHPSDWRLSFAKDGVIEGKGFFGNSPSWVTFETN